LQIFMDVELTFQVYIHTYYHCCRLHMAQIKCCCSSISLPLVFLQTALRRKVLGSVSWVATLKTTGYED
jgi:hypothetical protein